MNIKQMAILTATVVALVVIVTLMKVGLGGQGSGSAKPAEAVELPNPHLNFATTHGPASPFDNQLPPDREAQIEGHHDFWFTNDNNAPVDLYLKKVSCNRCLSVQVGLAPEGSSKEARDAGNDVDWHPLETEELHGNAKGYTVPANRGGWVRLTWKDEAAEGKILSADLRTTSSVGIAPDIRLEFAALFVEPVRVLPPEKELNVGTLTSGDELPHLVRYTIFSSTRDHFSLVPESAEQQAQHPFVTLGNPVKLSEEKCRSLEKEYKRAFLCAYEVPLTVWERLKDGREHDLGPFRSGVRLKSDSLDEDVTLYVRGTVRTDGLKVLCDEHLEDRIVLGTFKGTNGTVKTVRVETPRGTALKVERKPAFMEAELKDESNGAGKTWGLTVTVKADAVSGHFPRPDDPTLDDTSIYLKANERLLRIPVSGTASQR